VRKNSSRIVLLKRSTNPLVRGVVILVRDLEVVELEAEFGELALGAAKLSAVVGEHCRDGRARGNSAQDLPRVKRRLMARTLDPYYGTWAGG
jgi:hypothetical protein